MRATEHLNWTFGTLKLFPGAYARRTDYKDFLLIKASSGTMLGARAPRGASLQDNLIGPRRGVRER